MKKSLRLLEGTAATALMLSKYFLAISSAIGWWLSIIGYVLTAIFNGRIGLKIVVPVISGLALLSAYGLYKWTHGVMGLQTIDFVVVSLSSILATILIISEARRKKPYWILQAITTITFSFAFIALGLKMEIGWYALLVGHLNNVYLYYRKQAYIIVVMQIVSIVIVLIRIF